MATIVFLGSGTGPFVVGKSLRYAGGFIIQASEMQFHLDPGPGSLSSAAACGVNLRANTAVLVSHAHINHCNDVNAVLSAMTYDGLDRKGVLISNNSVINGSEDSPACLTKFHRGLIEKFIVAKPNQRIGIEDIEIRTLATKHSEQHNIGFKFFTPNFVLTYASDTAYSREFLEQYEKSDILILNVVHPFSQKSDDNLNSEDAVKIISHVKPQLAIIQHFGKQMLEADPLYEAREIQKRSDVQVIHAQDGLVVSPGSYSASMKQRTLNLYKSENPAGNAPDA